MCVCRMWARACTCCSFLCSFNTCPQTERVIALQGWVKYIMLVEFHFGTQMGINLSDFFRGIGLCKCALQNSIYGSLKKVPYEI